MIWRAEIYPAADTGSENNLNPFQVELEKSHCVASIRFLVQTWRLSAVGANFITSLFFLFAGSCASGFTGKHWIHRRTAKLRSTVRICAPIWLQRKQSWFTSSINITTKDARRAKRPSPRPYERCVRWCRTCWRRWRSRSPVSSAPWAR